MNKRKEETPQPAPRVGSLVSEVLQGGAKIREQSKILSTTTKGNIVDELKAAREIPGETQRCKNPMYRPFQEQKEELDNIAFNERDERGARLTVTALMDEAVTLVIATRKAAHLAQEAGLTPTNWVLSLIDREVSGSTPKKSKPRGDSEAVGTGA